MVHATVVYGVYVVCVVYATEKKAEYGVYGVNFVRVGNDNDNDKENENNEEEMMLLDTTSRTCTPDCSGTCGSGRCSCLWSLELLGSLGYEGY